MVKVPLRSLSNGLLRPPKSQSQSQGADHFYPTVGHPCGRWASSEGAASSWKAGKHKGLKAIIEGLAVSIEGGSTFSEGLAQYTKAFNKLYINMVKAGELGGVLEVVLNRLSEFMEKAEKIKGKVIAAMFYPAAVMVVAGAILLLLMIVVVPKFKQIFADMLEGKPFARIYPIRDGYQ